MNDLTNGKVDIAVEHWNACLSAKKIVWLQLLLWHARPGFATESTSYSPGHVSHRLFGILNREVQRL